MFETSEEYGDRFISLGVEQLLETTSDTKIRTKDEDGVWRHLEGEDNYLYSFRANVMLDKDRSFEGTDMMDVKEFFSGGLSDASDDEELDRLLGEWTIVDYYQEEFSTSTTEEGDAEDKSDPGYDGNEKINIELRNTNNNNHSTPSSRGAINPKVIGIAVTVFGVCLLAFLYVTLLNRPKKRKRSRKTVARKAAAATEDAIDGLHVNDEEDKHDIGSVPTASASASVEMEI